MSRKHTPKHKKEIAKINPVEEHKKEIDRLITNINDSWRKQVDLIIQTGNYLLQLKIKTPHGEFETIVAERCTFTLNTAEILMKIATDKRITNTKYAQLLPPSWRTLHEISKLDNDTFNYGVENSLINNEMIRDDVGRVKSSYLESKRIKENNKQQIKEKPARVSKTTIIREQPKATVRPFNISDDIEDAEIVVDDIPENDTNTESQEQIRFKELKQQIFDGIRDISHGIQGLGHLLKYWPKELEKPKIDETLEYLKNHIKELSPFLEHNTEKTAERSLH